MLSMCGLICRFFHGWRQSEAVALMRQVAVLPQTSLLVENCDQIDAEKVKSIYCQPLCGLVIKKQLLWRENNKQVLTVTPKEKINLMKWTQFTPEIEHQQVNEKSNSTTVAHLPYNSANEITVFLEATYNNKLAEQLPEHFITVSEMAELYAWRCNGMFGLIIKTTPSQFVSMIHAFFNGSLFVEDSLQICKMSTVDTAGKPKLADQTVNEKARQIVHNLENQIENAKVHFKKSSLVRCVVSAPGTLNRGYKSRRASKDPIFNQPSTSNGVFPHSIHHASDELNMELQMGKLPDDEDKREVIFPEIDVRDTKALTRVGFERRYYPLRIRSETDLHKATQLIRGNLANIVEKYLSKLEVNVNPVPNAVVKKLSVMPQFYVPRQIPRSIDDCAICNFHRNKNNNFRMRADASDSSPETRSEIVLRNSTLIGNELDSSFRTVFALEVDSSTGENFSPNEFSSDSLNETDIFCEENAVTNDTLLTNLDESLKASTQRQNICGTTANLRSSFTGKLLVHSESLPSDRYLTHQMDDLTDESFSSDSLGSSPKSIKINIPATSVLSSPEELSQKSVALDFPSHWRDEYERIFAPVNNTLSKEILSSTIRLQPISEVDSMAKGCLPDKDFDPFVKTSENSDRYSSVGCHVDEFTLIGNSAESTANADYLTNDFVATNNLTKADCSREVDGNILEVNLPCELGESLASYESTSPNNKLSPADSVPESGFASLRESEYNNSEPISDVFCGVPVSKSRDSLNVQELARTLDNFPEESIIGLSDSISDSILSSARGSVSDNMVDQENIKAAFQQNYNKNNVSGASNSVAEEVSRNSSADNSIQAVDSVSSCDTIVSVNSNLDKLQGKDATMKDILIRCEEFVPTSAAQPVENQYSDDTTKYKWYLESETEHDIKPTAFTKTQEVQSKLNKEYEAVGTTSPLFKAAKINIETISDNPADQFRVQKLTEMILPIKEIKSKSEAKLSKETVVSVEQYQRNTGETRSTSSLKSMDSKKSGESSLTSNNSSSSDFQDRVSLKSADSSDTFPHFDSIRANPKPKRKHKKTLTVDREDSTDINGMETTREEDRARRNKKKQKKSKIKEESSTGEKKFAFKSLKELLKVNKSKDRECKKEKIKSPSLLKRFENLSKNIIQKENNSPSKRPTIVHYANDCKTEIGIHDNGQGHLSRSIVSQSGQDDLVAINNKTSLRKLSHSESPGLYRKVLLKNMSSSQESVETKLASRAPAKEPPMPVMGTKALSARNSFSVTIGFKPHVENELSTSDGSDVHLPIDCAEHAVLKRTLNKKSSSMEILVCGKIKEHGSSRRRSSANSREGSFRLHREISVETLFEDPEYNPHPVRQSGETYQEFLQKVRRENVSRQSSNWSLYENGSMESLPSGCLKTRLANKHSLPLSTRNFHLAETSNSNPNLALGSPSGRCISQSASFTSSPYRRQFSSSTHSSPIKRPHSATPGKSLTYGNDPRTDTSLIEEDESVLLCGSSEIQPTPPNILIYAGDNHEYYQDVKETVLKAVNNEKYVVYHLTNDMTYQSSWRTQSALLVICGDITTTIDTVFIRHLLEGGQILSICSDFLKFAVPLYGNVEFSESSVVSLSYGKWKNVQLLHHKHCFHSSPKHVRNANLTGSSAVSIEPSSVEIKDEFGTLHKIGLKVLATDNTWGAPALLLADVSGRSGKAIFSQVHLEKNPQTGISDRLKACHLQQSNDFRLQILKDLLSSHFHLDVANVNDDNHSLTPAYLIGDKQSEFTRRFTPYANHNGIVERSDFKFRFSTDVNEVIASEKLLPIILSSSPAEFSTTKYFQNLKTKEIGRQAIYCDVITSTMHILSGNPCMPHGLVVICSRQTKGKGRGGNIWISPAGCAMMSVQLHIPNDSRLGKRLSFVQHLVSMAACLAVKQQESYEWMPLRLKWPNDIYMGEGTKLGGVLVEASMDDNISVVNVGLGINLDNSNPTTCINGEIEKRNGDGGSLAPLELEKYVAEVFNCLEKLIDTFQIGGPDAIFETYYSLWLHTNARIQVRTENQPVEPATVIGINEFGFLVAELESGRVTNLHPDGNSFDMMQGLVYQK